MLAEGAATLSTHSLWSSRLRRAGMLASCTHSWLLVLT